MNRLLNGSLVVMVAIMISVPAQADEGGGDPIQGGGASNWQEFKHEVKQAGRDIGKTGKEVGLGVADGAKAVKEFFTSDGDSGKGNAK